MSPHDHAQPLFMSDSVVSTFNSFFVPYLFIYCSISLLNCIASFPIPFNAIIIAMIFQWFQLLQWYSNGSNWFLYNDFQTIFRVFSDILSLLFEKIPLQCVGRALENHWKFQYYSSTSPTKKGTFFPKVLRHFS